MSEKSTIQAVSLFTKVINWSSIIGAVGTIAFCIWGLSSRSFTIKRSSTAFIQQASMGTTLLFFTNFASCGPQYSSIWCF